MCIVHIINRVHVVHPYSRIDTTAAWKKLGFILSDRSDFHMINNLSIAIHAFAMHILMSFSVGETRLPRYVYLSNNFREPPFKVEMSSFVIKRQVLRFVSIHIETNAICCLLQTMYQGFGLGWCIWKTHYIICVVCIVYVRNSFCGVSSARSVFFLCKVIFFR